MQHVVQVLLFGPNLPPAGIATECVLNELGIRIPSHHQSVAFLALKAEIGGFDHDQLQLHWQTSAGAFMLVADSPNSQKQLKQLLPANLVTGLKGWHVATFSQKTVWNSLIYGAGLIVLAVMIGIWQYDHLLDWAASRISIETEHEMGKAVLSSYNKRQDAIQSGAAVSFVEGIGQQLTKGSKYKYQWLVIKDDAVNAFAMPGGIVIVNTGLLKKAGSADEVAAVLAHEIQHVEQRHALKNMMNSAGVAAIVMLVLGDANAALIMIAHQVSTQFFSRQVEAEADLKGAQLLLKQGIRPDGMASFFKRLASEQPKQSKVPAWLSSHPDTQNRIQMAEKFAQQHPCADCQVLNWDIEAILENINTHTQAAEAPL
ncbi:MAG: M48 family metallopeptidase [Methylophilus sp.]|nr:M48 family metallopeptidase [Methylophilus sp.]